MKRVFLVVLDSFGIGAMPDCEEFGDKAPNTLGSVFKTGKLNVPNMIKLGLGSIDGVSGLSGEDPIGVFGRLSELSRGKDTTVGHYEISGLVSEVPFKTYPDGFPKEIIEEFERRTGRKVICNKPYSGTDVIRDYGEEQLKSGALIVYTSADSVFQIAANEEIISREELYEYCAVAREMLVGDNAVARVIARPFVWKSKNDIERTDGRRDFSLDPYGTTMLDLLKEKGKDVISVGKIYDIFNGKGITEKFKTKNNKEGIDTLLRIMDRDFSGLCFVNLVDFDMVYGHRNDAFGYALALSEFDEALGEIIKKLKEDDLLIITADHGCDPGDKSTDHTREFVPVLLYKKGIKPRNFGSRAGFISVAGTVTHFCLGKAYFGETLLEE